MMGYFRIANWDQYQHYKDRSPPWIKLHVDILSSKTWVMLDDESRVLALASMIIASKNSGKVPNDASYMKRVAYLKTCNFKPLIEIGFLIDDSVCYQALADDSNSPLLFSSLSLKGGEGGKRKIATHLPNDWVLPDEWGDWAVAENFLTTEQVVSEWPNFKDYYISHGKAMKDWQATWRNWVRRSHEFKKKAG